MLELFDVSTALSTYGDVISQSIGVPVEERAPKCTAGISRAPRWGSSDGCSMMPCSTFLTQK